VKTRQKLLKFINNILHKLLVLKYIFEDILERMLSSLFVQIPSPIRAFDVTLQASLLR